MISKIISGGQTGADRTALDFAIEHGIPHGGWCPKGRKAEDGPIHERYQLQEHASDQYLKRTEQNVIDSDGTVIVTIHPVLTGGSKRTADFARKHRKPWLHIHKKTPHAGEVLRRFIEEHVIRVLNVAGPRASSQPGIGEVVGMVLEEAFAH